MALLDIDWTPSVRQRRTFGLVGAALFPLLAWHVHRRHRLFGFALTDGAVHAVVVALGVAAALFALLTLVRPAWLLVFYRLLMAVTLPIGLVVSQLAVVAIYYGILTPVGLLRRLFGKDPMARGFDRSATSYWIERRPTERPGRYFEQY